MQNQLPDFLIIPSRIIQDKECLPIDGPIFGIIYWYAKLRLQKCILSNQTISELLNCSLSSVAHGISRLNKKGFVGVVLDDNNHRLELVPLLSFNKENAELVEPKPLQEIATPLANNDNAPRKNLHDNNIDLIIKDNKTLTTLKVDTETKAKKIFDETLNKKARERSAAVDGEFIIASSRGRNRKSNGYGDAKVNDLIAYFKKILELEVIDGTVVENRRFAYLAIKKFGFEKLAELIVLLSGDNFWRGKITSMQQLYRKGALLSQIKKPGKNFESERGLAEYEKYG